MEHGKGRRGRSDKMPSKCSVCGVMVGNNYYRLRKPNGTENVFCSLACLKKRIGWRKQ
jgi:hypothetical protein